ncbi:unnamed protein product [Rhizopus stolonifer]
MDSDLTIESNFTTTVNCICSTNERLFRKLKVYMNDLSKTGNIIDQGIEYNTKLLRRYNNNDSSSEEELTYPDKLPLKRLSGSRNTTMSDKDYNFVKEFKKSVKGNMC